MTTNNISGITSVEEIENYAKSLDAGKIENLKTGSVIFRQMDSNPTTATDRFNKNLFEIATILLDNKVIEDEQGVDDFCDGVPFLIEETRAETVNIAYGSTVRVKIKSHTLITSEGADKSYSANAIREVSVSPGSKVNPAIDYEKINKELAKFKANI